MMHLRGLLSLCVCLHRLCYAMLAMWLHLPCQPPRLIGSLLQVILWELSSLDHPASRQLRPLRCVSVLIAP